MYLNMYTNNSLERVKQQSTEEIIAYCERINGMLEFKRQEHLSSAERILINNKKEVIKEYSAYFI